MRVDRLTVAVEAHFVFRVRTLHRKFFLELFHESLLFGNAELHRVFADDVLCVFNSVQRRRMRFNHVG